MNLNNVNVTDFKEVIELIVDSKMNKRGITKYISAIVNFVDENGYITVYIPPDNSNLITGLLNKTGEVLIAGDSVELCSKNGSINNAWVAIKHSTNNSGGGGGTSDYNSLSNKPSINGDTLVGDMTIVEDKNYVHIQDVASSVWTVNHNLGKYPSVTIVDSTNAEVIADIQNINTNTLTVTFQAENSGKVYCN